MYQFEEDLQVNWVNAYGVADLHPPSGYSIEAAIAVSRHPGGDGEREEGEGEW